MRGCPNSRASEESLISYANSHAWTWRTFILSREKKVGRDLCSQALPYGSDPKTCISDRKGKETALTVPVPERQEK